jgi:PAS domain S-box-containing protein
MKDVDKTKEQLIAELARLQQENAELKASADELRRVEDELRVLHEAAFEGIMIHEKGVLLKANDQYFRMFGYEPGELVGKQIIPLTVVPETLDPEKRRVTDDGVTTYEIEGVKKDGTTFLMEVRGKLMEYQGRKVRGVAVMDITERKKVEDALRESEEMLRFLSTRLFEAQEQERSRLSKELHDQLGHDLVLFKSWLRSIERKLEERQILLKKECENTIAAVDEIIENVRRISRDLMPSILEDLGLAASIQSLVENFSEQHSIQITLDIEDIDNHFPRVFPREAQINLYRIFQEILTNISKHASATQVSVVVKEENGDITFRVRDNGKGFELSKVRERKFNTRGVGLTAMTERIHMLGGTFDVHSQPGEGTEIRFRVPIGEKEA